MSRIYAQLSSESGLKKKKTAETIQLRNTWLSLSFRWISQVPVNYLWDYLIAILRSRQSFGGYTFFHSEFRISSGWDL
jgi:hypothetical protein